jgi:hypothetical protein
MSKSAFCPKKEFDQELVDLSALFVDKGWEFPGDAITQLAADAEEQRVERAAYEKARTELVEQYETFVLRRYARYKRFVALLKAARGMFRDDQVVMAELDRFGRIKAHRPRKTKEQTEAA